MNIFGPLSWVYGGGVALHRRVRSVPSPASTNPRVISVGNLEAGGTGKTPLTMWILTRLIAGGARCAYVSRGYRGKAVQRDTVTCVLESEAVPMSLAGLRVLSRAHPLLARDVGDEGAMVCMDIPGGSAFFCADKPRAVRAASDLGVDVIVLDDAFQSWGVARHVDIVLLDAVRPFGNGRLLPVGRLREKPAALARADAIVLNGVESADSLEAARGGVTRWIDEGTPVAGMIRRIVLEPAEGGSGAQPDSFLAVSGIGRPGNFERALTDAGARIVGHERFPDHHDYAAHDVERIQARARRESAGVVTTEKDYVKLRHTMGTDNVWVARLEVSLVGDELPLA